MINIEIENQNQTILKVKFLNLFIGNSLMNNINAYKEDYFTKDLNDDLSIVDKNQKIREKNMKNLDHNLRKAVTLENENYCRPFIKP